jgi:hypothetical protein
MLIEKDRKKLDGIIQQMTSNKETDQTIQTVVNDFKQKYSLKETPPEEIKKAQDYLKLPWLVQAAKEVPGAIGEMFVEPIAKFGASLKEIPGTLAGGGKATQETYDLPGLKPFKSYISESENTVGDIVEGKQPLWKAATPFAEVPLSGIQTKIAGKQLFKAGGLVKDTLEKAGEKVVNPLAKTTSDVANYGVSRLPKALSIFSGETDDVIKYALKDTKVADLGLQQGDAALRNAVNIGAKDSIQLRNNFTNGYGLAKDKILGQYTKTLVPKSDVKTVFDDLLKENNVKILKDGSLDFSRSNIVANPGEMGKIKQAYETLNTYKSFNLSSLDDYKQLVGKLARFPQEGGGSSKSPALGRLYYQLNDIAATKLPKDIATQYIKANNDYSKNIELYDDMVDAFNSGDPFSRLAGTLSKNKDTLRQVIEFYETKSGKQILPIVAGRELGLNKMTSTGAFSWISPRSWIDFFISPKKQGEIILKLGSKLPKQ